MIQGIHKPGTLVWADAPTEVDPRTVEQFQSEHYAGLYRVLLLAYQRVTTGKGKERHATGEPFEAQPICKALELFGEHAWDGQVVKKMLEADRLSPEAGDAQLVDCINYLAARIVVRQKGRP